MVISLISAKVARLVLAAIPPTQRNMGTQIQSEIISDYNKVKPLVKVTYKDKKRNGSRSIKHELSGISQSFRPSLETAGSQTYVGNALRK